MLFLLASAKLNQAERFGVGLGETYGLNSTRTYRRSGCTWNWKSIATPASGSSCPSDLVSYSSEQQR
jgi:hypothetical protein